MPGLGACDLILLVFFAHASRSRELQGSDRLVSDAPDVEALDGGQSYFIHQTVARERNANCQILAKAKAPIAHVAKGDLRLAGMRSRIKKRHGADPNYREAVESRR